MIILILKFCLYVSLTFLLVYCEFIFALLYGTFQSFSKKYFNLMATKKNSTIMQVLIICELLHESFYIKKVSNKTYVGTYIVCK